MSATDVATALAVLTTMLLPLLPLLLSVGGLLPPAAAKPLAGLAWYLRRTTSGGTTKTRTELLLPLLLGVTHVGVAVPSARAAVRAAACIGPVWRCARSHNLREDCGRSMAFRPLPSERFLLCEGYSCS